MEAHKEMRRRCRRKLRQEAARTPGTNNTVRRQWSKLASAAVLSKKIKAGKCTRVSKGEMHGRWLRDLRRTNTRLE